MSEKPFSIEETLIDLMGFVKKFFITAFSAIVVPYKILKNTLEIQADPEAKKKYLSHFFYFVICVLITMSYYRTLVFDRYNHIHQSVRDVILLSKDYLVGTSLIEKLVSCIFFIAGFYVIIWVLAELLVIRMKDPLKSTVKYFFKRTTYFFAGSSLLILLLPFFRRCWCHHIFRSPLINI